MNRFNLKNLPARAKQIATGATAFAVTAMASAPAFAGDLAEGATSGMDKAELMLIGVAILTLCGVIALIRAGKKAAA
jgi:hypothetical protein